MRGFLWYDFFKVSMTNDQLFFVSVGFLVYEYDVIISSGKYDLEK